VRAGEGAGAAPSGADPGLPARKARAALGDDARVFDATAALVEHGGAALFFPFDGHLTADGNRVVAEALLADGPPVCAARALGSSVSEAAPRKAP
jgi:hypothetical protein